MVVSLTKSLTPVASLTKSLDTDGEDNYRIVYGKDIVPAPVGDSVLVSSKGKTLSTSKIQNPLQDNGSGSSPYTG